MAITNWKVLLVGGSSGTGKSLLARHLARHFDIPLTEVDDIRIALQKTVDPMVHPDLFTFYDDPDFLQHYDSKTLANKLVDVGREVWPAFDTLITKHIVCDEPVVFEGDAIIPELLAQRDQNDIRAVFLWDELDSLKERVQSRNRPGTKEETVGNYAEFSYNFGIKLREQAIRHGFAIVQASPVETLMDRVLDQITKL